jgi:hypothetical protein
MAFVARICLYDWIQKQTKKILKLYTLVKSAMLYEMICLM